jgi:hypothetical protein
MRLNFAVFGKTGQMRIQQMAFMIVAVVFFFILVGLFFLGWQYKSIAKDYNELQKEQAISSLKVISAMPELNCDDSRELCVDSDKLEVLSKTKGYEDLWPVASIKVIKVYPAFNKTIKCPSNNCNYYEVYNSGQKNAKEFSTYVSICKKESYQFEKCEIGKLILGVKLK